MPITIPLHYRIKISFVFIIFFLFIFPIKSFANNNALAYYYYLLSLNEKNSKLAENYLKKAIQYDPKSLYLKKKLVIFYLLNQKIKEAEKLASKLHKKFPYDKELNLLLAKIYLFENRPYKATSVLENILEKNPKDKNILSLLISIYLDQKDWNSAITNLDKLLKIYKNNYIAWLFKARILKEQKKYKEAKKAYLKALELSSDDKTVLIEVLKFLEEIHDTKTAEILLKKFISKYPEDKELVKILLRFYIENKNWKESEKLLKKYLKTTKYDPKFLFFLGYSLEKQNKLEEALKVYEKILPESDWFWEASKRIIDILRKKDKKKAINYLKHLESNKNKSKNWYVFLSNSAEVLDLCNKGIEYALEGLKHYPEDLDLKLALASNYACIWDYKKVLEITQPLLKKYPEDPYVLNFVGYSYVELGINLDKAEKLLLKALQIKIMDPYILDSIGWLYYKKGNLDLALQYLEKAVNKLDEDEAIILEHLADILMKKGEKKKAYKLYQRALKAAIHKIDKERIQKKITTILN